MPATLYERLHELTAADPRYRLGAYVFLFEALEHSSERFAARGTEPGHISGRQLLEGIREYARQQYGPLARLVLNSWGVQRCEDWGEIVFHLVEADLIKRRPSDRRADFGGGYDFAEAFDALEEPSARRLVPPRVRARARARRKPAQP